MNNYISSFGISIFLIQFVQADLLKPQPIITVVGTGYVGLVTGAGLAECGNNVICADIDAKKITLLQQGYIPIYEPGLKELVARNVYAKRLTFTDNVEAAIAQADIIFVAVGTPTMADGSTDLSYIEAVVDTIANTLTSYKIICMKSTVPIGTCQKIRTYLESKKINGKMFSIVSNPEFLREGTAVHDFLNPERIVAGVESENVASIIQEIYQPLLQQGTKIVVTNLPTSETIKYASNSFLAVKVSFINEMANLCDAVGSDIQAVSYAMGLDKRICPHFLNPGPGFGGSCFPKDCKALLHLAKKNNVALHVVSGCLIANELQKKVPAQKLLALMNNDIKGKTIAILGLAFKANTDDVRSSPAYETIKLLQDYGAYIKAYDPVAMKNMQPLLPTVIYCSSIEKAVFDADAVIIMTEWQEFKKMDLMNIGKLMKQRVLVDARNITNADQLKALGFTFDFIGRSWLRES